VKSQREAYFQANQDPVLVPAIDGEGLRAGHRLQGPVIIERPGDTVVIPPGVGAYVDGFRNIRIDFS
jgi:N-methylhydantoinase A/oxoprolinase/acetone carboxylase beta subunit